MKNIIRFEYTKNETRTRRQQERMISLSAFRRKAVIVVVQYAVVWRNDKPGQVPPRHWTFSVRADDPPGCVIYTGGLNNISPGARAIPGTRTAGLRGGAQPSNEIGPFDTVARCITRVADTDTGRRRRRRCPRILSGKRRQVYNKPKLLSFRHRRDDRVVF